MRCIPCIHEIILDNADETAKILTANFRKRRIEKYPTLKQVAEKTGVAVSNIVKFKKKWCCLEIFDKVNPSCGDLLLNKIPAK